MIILNAKRVKTKLSNFLKNFSFIWYIIFFPIIVPRKPPMIIRIIMFIYGVKEKPKKVKTQIFKICLVIITNATVAMWLSLGSLNVLTIAAIKAPVAPTITDNAHDIMLPKKICFLLNLGRYP